MRVVRNNGYIRRRRRAARWLVFAGLMGLFLAMAMTLRPALILPAYGVLIIGFLVFNAGMQQIGKWSRRPRADEVLDSLLRRLNDRYTLIHYPNMDGWRPEHVLVFPGGLVVLTPRAVHGKVRVEGDRWSRVGNFFIRFFGLGGPQLGNPTLECNRQQEALVTFLTLNDLPGVDEVEGLIVFLNPRVELEVVSSDLTVLEADELLHAIRDLGSESRLHNEQRKELVAALSLGEEIEGPTSLPARDPGAKNARAA
jgi:hypothetical protein